LSTVDRAADYVALAIAIHGAAVVIVNMTPTPKDNAALDKYSRLMVKLYRVVEILAGVVSRRVKQ
jgi:hypothetical protein